jgi:hypothetical protein
MPQVRTATVHIWNSIALLCSAISTHASSVGFSLAGVEQIASSDPSCVRLQQIPGVGPLISTAVVSAIGNGSAFKKGREFAAWLGLVPRQWSTGGKAKLLGISKRGNPYLRKMFIHGARAAVLGWHSPASECCGVWSADGRYYFFVGTDSASSVPQSVQSIRCIRKWLLFAARKQLLIVAVSRWRG